MKVVIRRTDHFDTATPFRTGASIPLPPGMRVRTGRFEKLRLAETGYSEAVEVGNGQHSIQSLAAVAPPTAAIGRHLAGNLGAGAEGAQFPIDGRTTFPMLELDRSQPMAQPLV
jgi:hypothetical protein